MESQPGDTPVTGVSETTNSPKDEKLLLPNMVSENGETSQELKEDMNGTEAEVELEDKPINADIKKAIDENHIANHNEKNTNQNKSEDTSTSTHVTFKLEEEDRTTINSNDVDIKDKTKENEAISALNEVEKDVNGNAGGSLHKLEQKEVKDEVLNSPEGENEIDENSDDESNMRLDRYGFLTGDDTNLEANASMSAVSLARNRQSLSTAQETEKERRRRVRLENLRLEKWISMSKNWDYQLTRRRDRFKRRIRKGIPDSFRQRVWPIICGSKEDQAANPDLYKNLLTEVVNNTDPVTEKVHESISRDVGRTFPRHIIFKHANGIGQRSLSNVLRAYSVLDKEVGYCQGMGFVVGLLLGYLREEETFWILKTLMLKPPWMLSQLYKPGMPGAQLLLFQFESLLQKFLPDVASHLEKENIVPSMYATQWFITVFAYNFPFDIVVRIWDIFLFEGWKIVFRVAITILKEHRKEILSKSFEQILEYFRGIPPTLDAELILEQSFKLNLKTAHLTEIEKKFQCQ